jgi:polysaccharide transporter, PST family
MKKHLSNILAVGGSDVLSRLLGFATNAYLARVLGTSSFGIMSMGLSVLSYVAMLSSPGLQIQGTREIASRQTDGKQFASSLNSLRLVLAIGLVALTALVGNIFIESGTARFTTVIFALSAIPLALSLDWYFQGREDLVAYSGSKIIVAVVYLLMTVLIVQHESDVARTAVAFLTANTVATLWLLYLYIRDGKEFSLKWRPAEWRKLFRISLPLGISSFLAQTIMNLPILIIGTIISSHAAGLFNAAMKLIFAVLLVDRVFYAMFFPIISRQRSADYSQYRKTVALALKVVLAIAIPIVVAGIVYAGEIVTLVYGAKFNEAARPLQFLLVYFLASVVNTVIICAMIADSRETEYLQIMATATVLLIAVCVTLSLTHGLNGAALSLAVGEGAMTFLLYFRERKLFDRLTVLLAPSFLAGIIMVGALVVLNAVSMIVALLIAIPLFGIALWVLKGITLEEFHFLRARFV